VFAQRLVVHIAAHQHFGQGMPDLLANTEQADGSTLGCFVAAHVQ
jgi:hypothetical protein